MICLPIPFFGTLGINWLKLENYKNTDQHQNPHLIFEDRASGTGKTSTWTVVVTEVSLAAFSSGYCWSLAPFRPDPCCGHHCCGRWRYSSSRWRCTTPAASCSHHHAGMCIFFMNLNGVQKGYFDNWHNYSACSIDWFFFRLSIKMERHTFNGSYTVKKSRRFYGKYWQLAASTCTINFTGACKLFIVITTIVG